MFRLLAAVIYEEEEEEEERRNQNKIIRITKRNLRDTSDPFSYNPEYFRQHYRLTPLLAMQLINLLKDHVEIKRRSAIPFHLQVLSVLRLLAEGAFQKGSSNDFSHTISQASMSRCLETVLDAIIGIGNQFLTFPKTREERQAITNSFRRHIRIRSIIGLIDCFLVACRRSIANEEAFYNYKAGSSLNVQVITNANYLITNLSICPGSNTDRFTWNTSDIKTYLESLRSNADILAEEADSGYTPSPIMLTPILRAPEGSPEAQYTSEHVSTRCKVEQTFGILTNMWMVINRARKLYYQPEKIAKIITACVILHNYRILHGMIDDVVEIQPVIEGNEEWNNDYIAGIAERNNIINRYYR